MKAKHKATRIVPGYYSYKNFSIRSIDAPYCPVSSHRICWVISDRQDRVYSRTLKDAKRVIDEYLDKH